MLFTILVPNTHAQSKRNAMKQYLVHPGIRFLLCLETPSVSFSGNQFKTGVGLLLCVVTLFSILLLNAFLYLPTSLFILLLMPGSVTSFSWIKIGRYLLQTSIELNLLFLTLLLKVLFRLVLTVFQVSFMLSLDTLFSLKSNSDFNISLRNSFSFFRSSI